MFTPTAPRSARERRRADMPALAGAAIALAIAAPAIPAKPTYREQTYAVSHAFDVKPGGNLPPLVTARAFCHAWASTSDPACFDWDVMPFFPNAIDPDFDPGGETELDCNNPSQDGEDLAMLEYAVGPGGTFDLFNAKANCGATFGSGSALIIIDPYDGFGAWGPASSVSGSITSFGIAHADAAGLNVGALAEAYAFSAAGFKVQGLNLNPDGTIDWLPAIEDTVAGDAKASGKVVRDYDPICYKATNTTTGASMSGTLMSAYVEMCDEQGYANWTQDTLLFDSACGQFEIDLTDAHIAPSGYIFFRVEDGAVVESQASGVYAGLNPALGTSVPFTIDIAQAMQLKYDLTPVFDALLAPAPAGLQGNAAGLPDYSEIDLTLDFGDAAEDYAAAANEGGQGDDCAGDADADGVIDSTDLNIVLGEFGLTGAALAGDLNADNQVNSTDLNIVLADFAQACPPDEPVSGACCIDGACQQASFDECQSVNGAWGGINVACDTFNPCQTAPAGACCLADGTCVVVPASQDCQGAGAIYHGDGTTCDDATCQPDLPVGACCFDNGDCADAIDFQSCVLAPGSTEFHPGESCIEADCAGAQAAGACCLEGNQCIIEIELVCLDLGGTFAGPGTPCSDAACSGFQCPDDAVAEPEPCADDTNGGCNAEPPSFTKLAPGQMICGTAWAERGTRDTDWFHVSVAQPTQALVFLDAEFPAVLFKIAGDCAAPVIEIDGTPGQQVFTLLEPGTHTFFVATAGFEGLPCGTTNAYVLGIADVNGNAAGAASDCCAPTGVPGCDEPQCQAVVCQMDPLCCEVQWDQLCADLALGLCPVCAVTPDKQCKYEIIRTVTPADCEPDYAVGDTLCLGACSSDADCKATQLVFVDCPGSTLKQALSLKLIGCEACD